MPSSKLNVNEYQKTCALLRDFQALNPLALASNMPALLRAINEELFWCDYVSLLAPSRLYANFCTQWAQHASVSCAPPRFSTQLQKWIDEQPITQPEKTALQHHTTSSISAKETIFLRLIKNEWTQNTYYWMEDAPKRSKDMVYEIYKNQSSMDFYSPHPLLGFERLDLMSVHLPTALNEVFSADSLSHEWLTCVSPTTPPIEVIHWIFQSYFESQKLLQTAFKNAMMRPWSNAGQQYLDESHLHTNCTLAQWSARVHGQALSTDGSFPISTWLQRASKLYPSDDFGHALSTYLSLHPLIGGLSSDLTRPDFSKAELSSTGALETYKKPDQLKYLLSLLSEETALVELCTPQHRPRLIEPEQFIGFLQSASPILATFDFTSQSSSHFSNQTQSLHILKCLLERPHTTVDRAVSVLERYLDHASDELKQTYLPAPITASEHSQVESLILTYLSKAGKAPTAHSLGWPRI